MLGIFVVLIGLFSGNALALPTDEPVLVVEPESVETKNGSGVQAPALESKKDSKMETLSMPQTPVVTKIDDDEKSFFYKFSQSVSVRVGGAADIKEINREHPEDKEYSAVYSFKYLFPSDTYRHFEFGLDYVTQPKLYLTGLYRFIYQRTERLRPVLGAGLSMRFDKGDKFETPFTLNSYAVYMNAGLENFMKETRSLRLDLDVHAGNKDLLVLLLVGYSWGF